VLPSDRKVDLRVKDRTGVARPAKLKFDGHTAFMIAMERIAMTIVFFNQQRAMRSLR
jgi:hypothetical protein